ncbi:MAG: DUF3869 domain-containing protein [Bacteroidales bacterium]|nr:DUF3869 domain-containing protein [Candidatus Cacconaster merdequi]
MKKIFSSLVLAFAVLAGLFSSCNPEEIETTFEANPATATITVTVLEGETLVDITSSSTINAASNLLGADLKVNGNKIILTGNKAIVAQKITVNASATVEGAVKSAPAAEVSITPVLAGGISTYAVTMIILPADHDYSYKFIKSEVVDEELGQFTPKGTGHDHEGQIWAYNESEFVLDAVVKYDDIHGIEGSTYSFVGIPTLEAQDAVKAFAAGLGKENLYNVPSYIEFKVSAFSMYTVYGLHIWEDDYYDVIRKNAETSVETKVGEIIVTRVSTNAWKAEKALPGHEGHYHPGHGHQDVHGYSSNAGGGIFFAN